MLLPLASLQRKAGVDLKKGSEASMRWSVVSSALAAALVLTPVAAGYAPALCQDFSITNQVESGNAARRDLMRQLQAWWEVHAYYPRHASNNDEGGTVKVHLVILPDGRIFTSNVVASSGSNSLDAAGASVFRDVFVRPFPEGEPKAELDISLHYVLAHRHDEPVAAGYTQVLSKSSFTITNDPVKSPILETMLQRVCTGTVVRGAIRNHPWYGIRYSAEAIFFRKPDGTPWVKFSSAGNFSLSPVTEVGNMLQWTGHWEYTNPKDQILFFPQYTVWPDGDNHLSGAYGARHTDNFGLPYNQNGGTVDLTCATEVLPAVTWDGWWTTDTRVTPPGDPP
jgi:TonB family protein